MKPAAASSFDIADWFIRQAKRERVHLSPLKLHRLLYLAQATYAGNANGEALMPSMFVVSDLGPLEPNLYRAFEHGTPKVSVRDPAERVRTFLQLIWSEYGGEPIETLNRVVAADPAFSEAEARGTGVEISLDAMRLHHQKPDEQPARIVDGRSVRPWVPPAAGSRSGNRT
jgi:uncharacterized phage-associated protein